MLIVRRLESVLGRLPSPADYLHTYLRERRIRNETVTKVSEDGIEAKVFGIGLSRTATTSLAYALRELGYSTAHWKIRGKITGLEEFYRFDAVTDTPCACRFEQLYRAFPGSKFIYTTRDISDWAESVRSHFGCTDPRALTSRERIEEKTSGSLEGWGYENLLQWMYIHRSLYSRHDSWKQAYRAHDRRVRAFFRKRKERFLEINIIEEEQPWTRICTFLDRDTPATTFPHENSAPSEK